MAVVRRRIASLSTMLDEQASPQEPAEDNFLPELVRRIRAGKVIPIVSNTISNECIFHVADESVGDGGPPQPGEELPEEELFDSIENELGRSWAKRISYPLPDGHDLARVAQYKRAISRDDEQAKFDYLRFLKESLLKLARMNGADLDLLVELRTRIDESTFADLCQELEYPRAALEKIDPLRLLARFPIPIYITTSHHDFLERALVQEGKTPITQICFWSGETIDVERQHETNHDIEPVAERPVVYHLLGLERYPTTLALSEDDYLDFLTRVILDTDTRAPVIPLYLRDALSSSSLMLLGYRLQDWDFRVLFRGVIRPRQAANRMRSLIIQLTPEQQYHLSDAQKARDYLVTYFDPMNFNVAWGDTAGFLESLWVEWRRRQA